ncbi:UDP-N-acetylglucosamine1-carboxyvinyltransferase [Striga asiatica]|uniref:UDP-N-acetylglucosamine1-carboxyvinyltransferase n=1 Tax=Striga asiatica TaxID=4170 RepID=A0A5A7PBG5_STRAF|nr:UDP-N-acetylglucosamine1-carboxyvinyltransferase [Striga asiatica]
MRPKELKDPESSGFSFSGEKIQRERGEVSSTPRAINRRSILLYEFNIPDLRIEYFTLISLLSWKSKTQITDTLEFDSAFRPYSLVTTQSSSFLSLVSSPNPPPSPNLPPPPLLLRPKSSQSKSSPKSSFPVQVAACAVRLRLGAASTTPYRRSRLKNSFSPVVDSSVSVAAPMCYSINAFRSINKKRVEMTMKRHAAKGGSSSHGADSEEPKMDIRSILKDIEFVATPHMTWKQKKDLENRKVVSLGGKPQKKQRLPLSVARVMMKKQKEREEKMAQENAILGRFGVYASNSSKKPVERRRPEDRVLKSSEGNFRNGVLDVKHLLKSPAPRSQDEDKSGGRGHGKGKRKKGGKKKGGGKKRR